MKHLHQKSLGILYLRVHLSCPYNKNKNWHGWENDFNNNAKRISRKEVPSCNNLSLLKTPLLGLPDITTHNEKVPDDKMTA
jgi:hypothetical protein